jgi:hypothetical protein
MIKVRVGLHVLTWVFAMRAGDGNRTRTTSLGSVGNSAVTGADLAVGVLASDRCCPLFTLANGTLMARTSARPPQADSGAHLLRPRAVMAQIANG